MKCPGVEQVALLPIGFTEYVPPEGQRSGQAVFRKEAIELAGTVSPFVSAFFAARFSLAISIDFRLLMHSFNWAAGRRCHRQARASPRSSRAARHQPRPGCQ